MPAASLWHVLAEIRSVTCSAEVDSGAKIAKSATKIVPFEPFIVK